ncbi:hypothetical protein T02_7746 [Trichinella nativa]|nr:hypothetical protein T05_4725 [Trichinella murrelli]KRY49960.1 hypothetical protein T03_16700 [Trichinella britovi]KRZ53401.1 hypothetical protein T02_7746 [Trichinella nativa]KRZ94399.1 hypothetical protein T08_10543 [Trichinella sp. T8]
MGVECGAVKIDHRSYNNDRITLAVDPRTRPKNGLADQARAARFGVNESALTRCCVESSGRSVRPLSQANAISCRN